MNQANQDDIKRFSRRVNELRESISLHDPELLAKKTNSRMLTSSKTGVEFHLKLWDREVRMPFTSLEAYSLQSGAPLALIDQAMLLYYFSYADGYPLSGKWISFAELSNGRFYNQAFQSYTGKELYRHFKSEETRFTSAAERLFGEKHPLGSAAYAFFTLPNVPLMAVFWQGDEDFPSSYQVLFDASANHYLPTDGYAILGSTLTRKLIKMDMQRD